MTILIILFAVIISVGLYVALSYPLLKRLGVRERVIFRAIKFGLSLFFVQVVFQPYFAAHGMIEVGQILGLIASFFYVRKVLRVTVTQNILIIILLPIGAAAIAAPILFLLFKLA